jgi:cytochrome P450
MTDEQDVNVQLRTWVDVDTFEDVKEAWRCPHLSTRTAGPGDEEVREGTVVRLDGEAHKQRRRAMGQLLSKGGLKYFRDNHLFPAADAAVAEVLKHPDDDGLVRIEVRSWGRRVNQQLAAALVGFDGAVSPEGGDALFVLIDQFIQGFQGIFDNAFTPYHAEGELQKRSLVARDQIVETFYEPALERRRALLVKVEAGEMDAADLPQDLLMLIAQQRDPAWADEALARREAVFLLGAGVHTTSNSLVWTLRELFEYFVSHPEEEANRNDETFLLSAAREALRLHPVTAGFVRRAEEDVDLPSGLEIPKDTFAVIRNGPPASDTDVFGADALEFNPYRELENGVPAFGFAFGAGPHMCFGMPIVMGAQGLDGSLMYLLKSLMKAGARLDPDSDSAATLAAFRGKIEPAATARPLTIVLDPA